MARLDGKTRVTRLKRIKPDYCSTPKFLPRVLRQCYEDRNWLACKLHDQNRGIKGTIPKEMADIQFLRDSLKYGKIGKVLSYASYLWVRYVRK